MFYSTKTYNNDRGLSCCYRQWRATHSHCQLLHGYSIGVKIIFGCETLDERNWVVDFGGLKKFEQWLKYMFDHTVLIAADDPEIDTFRQLDDKDLIDLRVMEAGVGCEKFAQVCSQTLSDFLQKDYTLNRNVYVKSVEVFEHGANSAIYKHTEQY